MTSHSPAPTATPRVVITLGLEQILAWGSSYYLPGVLALRMAEDLHLSAPVVFAAFSFALLIAGLVGPWSGRSIDRLGGRPVLALTNLIFALGLVRLAFATSTSGLFEAWALIGLGMGAGLYEAAFSTLVRLYGHASRNPITGITLIAGFASTVAWPLSAALAWRYGWRTTCLCWAGLHLVVGLPLSLSLPRVRGEPASHSDEARPAIAGHRHDGRTGALLAYVFAVTWFIAAAMASHLPTLLQAAGATTAVAIGAGALVGPAQVAGRLLEFGFLRRYSPLLSARLAALAHPLAAGLLGISGAGLAAPFALLHGAGNGIMTIAKGTLPLLFFGPEGYGARQGWLMLPARLSQALAPFLFGLLLERLGLEAIWASCLLGLTAFLALLALSPP